MSTYKGIYENGDRVGTGTLFENLGQSEYEGDFQDDLPHGFGRITWMDGAVFVG